MSKVRTFDFDSNLPIRFVDDLYEIYLKEKSSILEVLLQNGVGMKACTNTKYEWLQSQLTPQSWTINATIGTWATKTLVFDSTAGLAVGSIIRFETSAGVPITNLQCKITAVAENGTDATGTVYGSTTDNQLVDTNVAKLVSKPQSENNKSFTEDNDRQPDLEYNYTQIFQDVFGLSGTALETLMYGNTNDITTHLGVSLYKIQQQMSEQMIFGRRIARSSSENGTFGGLISFVDVSGGNVKDASAGAISQTMINDMLEAINADGGEANTIVCSPYQARKISAFNTSGNNPMVSLMDRVAGTFVMKFIGDLPIWPNGMSLNIVVDSKFPKNQVLITNLDKLALVPMNNRQLGLYDATANGQDGVTAVIRGEYTLVCKDAKYSHAIIKNLATS